MSTIKPYIAFINDEQIINMGGPWIADLTINNQLVMNRCLMDNYLIGDDFLVYFIKYHQISRKQSENYFTINTYNLFSHEILESFKKFRAVFLKGFITENELLIYNACHDQLDRFKSTFNLKSELLIHYNT